VAAQACGGGASGYETYIKIIFLIFSNVSHTCYVFKQYFKNIKISNRIWKSKLF
jgi:hypothetical protein